MAAKKKPKFKVGQIWESRIPGDLCVILTINGADPDRPVEVFALLDNDTDTFTVDGYTLSESAPVPYDLVTLIENPETIREVLARLGNQVVRLLEESL